MTIYYSASNNTFYPEVLKDLYEQANSWPEDLKEVSQLVYDEFSNSPNSGMVRTSNEYGLPCWAPAIEHIGKKQEEERQWRNGELVRADIELNKVQDADPKAKGSVADWRNYRKALRALPEHPKFPDFTARPNPPDSI